MTHKFDVTKKTKLDNPKRREQLPPEEILKEIDLQESERFADIGCGIGYFTIPAAKRVGENGIVYALDISKEMINEVEGKTTECGLKNIRTSLSGEYTFDLVDNLVDKALLCTVLHEITDKTVFLAEVKRILKPGGKVAIVEWKKAESDWGPPIDHRLASEEAEELLIEGGWKQVGTKEVKDYFYLTIAFNE